MVSMIAQSKIILQLRQILDTSLWMLDNEGQFNAYLQYPVSRNQYLFLKWQRMLYY